MNKWHLAAAAWAAVVLFAITSLGMQWARGWRFETSLLALLPNDAHQPRVNEAVSALADAGSRRVLILVGNADPAIAERGADACAAALKKQAGITQVLCTVPGNPTELAKNFYFPWRYRLLSPTLRQKLLTQTDAQILNPVLEGLYSPMGPPRLVALESDPVGCFSDCLLDLAGQSALRLQDNHLMLNEQDLTWTAVIVQVTGGMSVAEQKSLLRIFSTSIEAARQAGASDVLRAGFVFHSAEAARQAQHEMSTIGFGSLLGILALIWLSFRSLKPLALVMLPIAVGCICALGISQWIFGSLHLLTLVFGTSIIGVAVDYGVLFVSGSASSEAWNAASRRRRILRPAAMAVATSLIAYAVLASLPFPILRQMGIFTMLGLSAAWLTALLWLPLLATHLPDASQGSVQKFLARLQHAWPRVAPPSQAWLLWGLLVALSLGGIFRLHSDDDVRQLYATLPETTRQEEKIQQLLPSPSAGQFFLVTSSDEQGLLMREEALDDALEVQKQSGIISGFQSVSQFVPSLLRQESDQTLQWRRIYRPGGLAYQLFAKLGSPEVARLARRQASPPVPPLLPETWLASPLSLPYRSLWLGKDSQGWASIVTVSGAKDPASQLALALVAKDRGGVQLVDHLAALGTMMGSFRKRVGALLIAGYALVAIFLWIIYGKDAWRILAPALLSAMLVAGLFGWLGLNFNLFGVFGILLSLDMGVDYGIFMQDRGSGDFSVSLLSASLSALSTLLSFGLLALSTTPALHLFGLSILLGIATAWLLAPCFTRETA